MKTFKTENPDYTLSPFTGMTRRHWKAAALHLLEGVFSHIENIEQAPAFPKRLEKTYPQPGDPAWKTRAMQLEGIVRTLNVAAPLIEEDPALEINGINLRNYYARHIVGMCRRDGPQSVPRLSDFDDKIPKQMICEFGGLPVGLMMARKNLWEHFSPEERDIVADALSDYGHGDVPRNNWRYFNVMMLSFLKNEGYEIDETRLRGHQQAVLTTICDDGWYRDGFHTCDNYSVWVYQLYSMILAHWMDRGRCEPETAKWIDERFTDFIETYPHFFGRDGSMPMWGRSQCYRTGILGALPFAAELNDDSINLGWLRRIASGCLMQFMGNPAFYEDGIPSLGFYGRFDPAVQSYSCAISPFWLGLAFVSLAWPEESAYWQAVENEGDWAQMRPGTQARINLDGPGFAFLNDEASGATELRPSKYTDHDINYNRIAYNTQLPWQADKDGYAAMAYSIKTEIDEKFQTPRTSFWGGEKDGVLYRRTSVGPQPGQTPTVNLADVFVPQGVLRVDRIRCVFGAEIRLGHYGLPHLDLPVEVRPVEFDGHAGLSATNGYHSLALIPFYGWNKIDSIEMEGVHPQAERSTLLYVETEFPETYGAFGCVACLMLRKKGTAPWTPEELSSVKDCRPLGPDPVLAGFDVTMADGSVTPVRYRETDARMQG